MSPCHEKLCKQGFVKRLDLCKFDRAHTNGLTCASQIGLLHKFLFACTSVQHLRFAQPSQIEDLCVLHKPKVCVQAYTNRRFVNCFNLVALRA